MSGGDGLGLASLVIFADCSENEIRQVAKVCHRRIAESGTTLIRAGDTVDELTLIMSGEVRVTGSRGLDGTLGPGDLIGELSLLSDAPAAADVAVESRAELMTIARAHLPEILAMPSVGPRLRAIAQARVLSTQGQVVAAASVPVIRRTPRMRGIGAGLQLGTRAKPVRSVALAVTVLTLSAAALFVLTQRNKATVVALDDLLLEVESGSPQPNGEPSITAAVAAHPRVSTPTPSNEPSPAGATSPASPAPPSDGQPGPGEPSGSAALIGTANEGQDAGPESPGEATEPAPKFRPPTPGIYTYDTSGQESISIAGASHAYPEQTHAVVSTTDGCAWHLVHHVLEEHRDEKDFCSSDREVTTSRYATHITFFGQEDGMEYFCDPPARTMSSLTPGSVERGTCHTADGDAEAAYDGRYVGPETLTVGSDAVETAHISTDFTMTGSARGTSHLELWLAFDTGMIVRMEREVDTLARAVWGDVRYREEATFHLISMTPRS